MAQHFLILAIRAGTSNIRLPRVRHILGMRVAEEDLDGKEKENLKRLSRMPKEKVQVVIVCALNVIIK